MRNGLMTGKRGSGVRHGSERKRLLRIDLPTVGLNKGRLIRSLSFPYTEGGVLYSILVSHASERIKSSQSSPKNG